jgi:branched-chain amino acid transport system permease protein
MDQQNQSAQPEVQEPGRSAAGGVAPAAASAADHVAVATHGPRSWQLVLTPRHGLLTRCLLTGLLLVFVGLIPQLLNTNNVFTTETIFVYAIVAVGMNISVGFCGQANFGISAFYAIGGYGLGTLLIRTSIGATVSLPIVLLAAIGTSYLLSKILLRLEHFALALGTFILAIAVWQLLLSSLPIDWGGGNNGLVVPPATFFGIALNGRALYYYSALVLVVVVFVSYALVRSRVGWAWRAAGADPEAASANGINVQRYMTLGFVISAVVGAMGGVLLAEQLGFVVADNFNLQANIGFLLAIIIGGLASTAGAVIGSAILVILSMQLQTVLSYPILIYGVLLFLVVRFLPRGIVPHARELVARWVTIRPAPSAEGAASEPPEEATDPALPQPPRPTARGQQGPLGVSVTGVSKHFGGVAALQDVSFEVEPGQTVAIIGPNGSGKSTMINVLGGLCQPDSGTVVLGSADVTRRRADARAALGLARTFQMGRLYEGLTAEENVLVGMHLRDPFDVVSAVARPVSVARHGAASRREARDLLQLTGLPPGCVTSDVGSLSSPERRSVELARALVMRPRVLLLDEPTSGMDPRQQETWIEHIKDMQAEFGLTMIVVEHVMRVVTGVADRVVVLNAGRKIADDTPAAVLNDDHVRLVYLGGHHA